MYCHVRNIKKKIKINTYDVGVREFVLDRIGCVGRRRVFFFYEFLVFSQSIDRKNKIGRYAFAVNAKLGRQPRSINLQTVVRERSVGNSIGRERRRVAPSRATSESKTSRHDDVRVSSYRRDRDGSGRFRVLRRRRRGHESASNATRVRVTRAKNVRPLRFGPASAPSGRRSPVVYKTKTHTGRGIVR